MRLTASSTSWSSKQYARSVDMISETFVFEGLRPSAVALTVMSRSVNMPLSFSPSHTGITPTSRCFIFAAASFKTALLSTTSTSGVIISLSCINHLLEFYNLFFASDVPEKRASGKVNSFLLSQWMPSNDVSGEMLYVGRANGNDHFLYRS